VDQTSAESATCTAAAAAQCLPTRVPSLELIEPIEEIGRIPNPIYFLKLFTLDKLKN
jgi:hypothetical protein